MRLTPVCVIIIIFSAACATGMQFEFSGGLAFDRPIDEPLPGLSAGYGWSLGVGFLPTERIGFSIIANSTEHKMTADTSNNEIARGASKRTALCIMAHYRFLRIRNTEFEAYFGASYNSINGGDSSGSCLDFRFNPEDLGYSGWGTILGASVLHPIGAGYNLTFGVKYNYLIYNHYEFAFPVDFNPRRDGSSLLINAGVIYRLDFSVLSGLIK